MMGLLGFSDNHTSDNTHEGSLISVCDKSHWIYLRASRAGASKKSCSVINLEYAPSD